jgi:hypothetical protein
MFHDTSFWSFVMMNKFQVILACQFWPYCQVIGPILSIVRNLHISQMLCEWKNVMLLEFNTNVVHSLDGTCNIQLWFQYAWWLKNIYCYTLHVIHNIIHLSLNNILTITWFYIWNLKGGTCSNLYTCPRNFHVTRPYWFPITSPPCSILKISSNF